MFTLDSIVSVNRNPQVTARFLKRETWILDRGQLIDYWIGDSSVIFKQKNFLMVKRQAYHQK